MNLIQKIACLMDVKAHVYVYEKLIMKYIHSYCMYQIKIKVIKIFVTYAVRIHA